MKTTLLKLANKKSIMQLKQNNNNLNNAHH